MIEDIVDACHHLALRKREGELRIQDRELRHHFLAENVTDLQFLFVVRDDGSGIHLGAGPGHGQDAADRNDLACGLFEPDVVFVPWIFVAVYGDGYGLGIVAAGTAAYGQKKIYIIVSCDLYAFAKFLDSRVRHDTCVLNDVLPVVFQDLHDLIVDPVSLDGAAAIDELDVLSVLRKLIIQILKRIISEVEFGCVLVAEIT